LTIVLRLENIELKTKRKVLKRILYCQVKQHCVVLSFYNVSAEVPFRNLDDQVYIIVFKKHIGATF